MNNHVSISQHKLDNHTLSKTFFLEAMVSLVTACGEAGECGNGVRNVRGSIFQQMSDNELSIVKIRYRQWRMTVALLGLLFAGGSCVDVWKSLGQ